jgi:nitrogen fixation protein NifU and related proteins
MKVIVTAVSPSFDSEFDPRFGRGAYFIIVDTETMQWEAFPNSGVDAQGGAGAVAVQFAAEHGANAVISGDFGPTASLALNAADVPMYLNNTGGSIRDVIDRFQAGALQQFNKPSTVSDGPTLETENSTTVILDDHQPQITVSQPDTSTNTDLDWGISPFSLKVRHLIESLENYGTLELPDIRGYVRGWCGDSIQIDLLTTGDIIQEARYVTDGCGATIACGSMITKLAQTKTLAEAQQITPEGLISALDGLPKGHEHCAELAVNTLRYVIQKLIETRGDIKTG